MCPGSDEGGLEYSASYAGEKTRVENHIWRLNVIGNGALSVGGTDLRYFGDHFVGLPMRSTWTGPPQFNIFGKSKPANDFIAWSIASPLISEQAIEYLNSNSWDAGVELLEFGTIKNRKYFAMNVTNIVDGVDFDRSDIFYSHPNVEGMPKKIVIKSGFCTDLNIYQFKGILGDAYVSAEVARGLAASGLTGFGLTRLDTDVLQRVIRNEPLNDYPGHFPS